MKTQKRMNQKEIVELVQKMQLLAWCDWILGAIGTLCILAAILFDIKWLVLISAVLLVVKFLIFIKLTRFYHPNHTFTTRNLLFTGEYPTVEDFDRSMLSIFGFKTEDYKTFTYTLINDPKGRIILYTHSRMIQWSIPEKEECLTELQNVFSLLLNSGLATEILVQRTLRDIVKEQKNEH